jgi:hypothetical protein
MPNNLGNYNEIFFAQEGLAQLESALGMAGRVYRDYDPNPAARGDTIRLRRPATFTAQDAPSTAQDVTGAGPTITLNRWKEVKFELTDRELSLSSNQIIEDHIRPAAYALANEIDQTLAALSLQVPWTSQAGGTFALGDVARARQVLFDNGVPMQDGRVSLMVDGTMEQNILSALGGQNIMGSGVDSARQSGSIGRLFGLDIFANQNTRSFASVNVADVTGALTANALIGATTIAFNGVTNSTSFAAGNTFVIAGNRQKYTVASTVAADGTGAVAAMTVFPAMVQQYNSGAVITFDIVSAGASKGLNLAFHRNAFALAMAPLSELGNQLGARIATISDPKTALAIRSRMYYEGGASKVGVALDVLYGVQVLDANMATRFYGG